MGYEQSKLVQAHQSLIAVVSAALGGGEKEGPPPNTIVPQNVEQLKFAMQTVLGAASVVG